MTQTPALAPTIGANHDALGDIIALGASLFPVQIGYDPSTGKSVKKPTVSGWQKTTHFSVNRKEDLSGFFAYGFHPETIGAYVIDLDDKGVCGEDELVRALGSICPEVESPECYVDTPNGRHLYFSSVGLPHAIIRSRNGLLPGVDIRAEHSGGWLVAPGSVGWSVKREEWTRYEMMGDFSSLPVMPPVLVAFLERIFASLDEGKAAQPELAPSYIQPAGAGEALSPESDPALASLFELARAVIRSPAYFERLVKHFVPNAKWKDKDLVTGDYSGNPGTSCHWTPANGVIKDFAEGGKGGDFLWWLVEKRGMRSLDAAREILSLLSIPDPSRPPPPPLKTSAEPATSTADTAISAVLGDWPLTDSGNAERLVHTANGSIAWDSDNHLWMTWQDTKWIVDNTGVLSSLAKRVARDIQAQADHTADDDKAERLWKWGITSEAKAKRDNMVTLAAAERGVSHRAIDFDSNPLELNTLSGIVDIVTGKVRPHDPSALMTQCCPYELDDRRPERFLAFLDEIFHGNATLVEWQRRYFGYLLSGSTRDHLYPIWWGHGKNGKSVLLSIIGTVMGDYCKPSSADTWLQNRGNQPVRDDLAALRGARFTWASEPDSGRALSIATIKLVSGGDPVTCRQLYGTQFTYRPQFKALLVTNHRPIVKSQDDGTWRRLRFIPFTYTVPAEKTVLDLDRKILDEEGGAILSWMVHAAHDWHSDGFPACPEIEMATNELKRGDDPLSEFLAERCVIGQGIQVSLDQFYAEYIGWAHEKNIRDPLTRPLVKRILQERGDVDVRSAQGAMKSFIFGMGVRERLS